METRSTLARAVFCACIADIASVGDLKMQINVPYKKLAWSVLILVLVVAERLWFDLGPNVEFVTVATLLAAVYLDKPYNIIIPLFALFVTDVRLGNTAIFVFTWSGYLMIGTASLLLRRAQGGPSLVGAGVGAALFSSLFFYLWTNFGVWLEFRLYPPTLAGLLHSYVMGLPFFRINLVSNLIFVTSAFSVIEMVRSWRLNMLQCWR